jgi:hypothetical protein
MRFRLVVVWAVSMCLIFLSGLWGQPQPQPKKAPSRQELLDKAIGELVKMQEEGGLWPYEGVYRVGGKIPVGYRVGGTACVADALLHAAPENKDAQTAVRHGLAFVLKELDDPLMAPSTRDAYDVRVWGHICALDFLCHARATKATGEHGKEVDVWVPKLVDALVTEEIDRGGWNYASHQRHASFVTAPAAQALLLARSQGEKVPDEVLQRARKVLEESRTEDGAFLYSGAAQKPGKADQLPGSIARSAACETTLLLLGGGSGDAIQGALDAFYNYWDELDKRRKKEGTHEGPYLIAPYYFYYGHRYAAQAIAMLPEGARQKERDRLLEVILKTRDEDGTWNDRVFARSRNYGTGREGSGPSEVREEMTPSRFAPDVESEGRDLLFSFRPISRGTPRPPGLTSRGRGAGFHAVETT